MTTELLRMLRRPLFGEGLATSALRGEPLS